MQDEDQYNALLVRKRGAIPVPYAMAFDGASLPNGSPKGGARHRVHARGSRLVAPSDPGGPAIRHGVGAGAGVGGGFTASLP